MGKLRIVHIIQSLHTGGAEKLLVDLAVNSKEIGNITVISQYPKSDLPFEAYLENNGIKTIYLNKRYGFDLGNIVELYKALNKINPDVVHTHLHGAVYAIPWYLRHKDPVKVHTVHTIAPMEFGKIHRTFQRFAFKFLNVIPVAISSSIRESIAKEYRIPNSKIPIVLNGIDVSKFSTDLKEHPSISEFTLINVASFNKWKNQFLLLKAFYRVLLKYPDLKLIFVGDGNEKRNIKNKAIEMGIENRITFTGITNDVRSYLQKAHVFILSSTFEGLPLTVLEAYAAGLPVISTAVGGIPDILTSGINGILVPSQDQGAMENAIIELYEKPELRKKMGDRNRAIVVDFDIKNTTRKYFDIYYSHGIP